MAEAHLQKAGQRLPAAIVDSLAASNPTQRIGVIPFEGGFKDLTVKEVSQAVDATAWWIEKQIGKATHPETIAYMGANDVRYMIFVLASQKAGYQTLLPSTRLSNDAYQHLLTTLDCKKFFYTNEKQRQASGIQSFRPDIGFFGVPEVEKILDVHGSGSYPYKDTFDEAKDKVALIIHSSGTTGMPKPVPLTHGYFATIDYDAHLPRPAGRQSSFFNDLGPDHLVLCTTPFFHLMGFLSFAESVFHGVPFINLPDKPLSVQLLADTVEKTKPTAAMLPPSILEDMSHSELGVNVLKKLDYVYYAGAPLAIETGNYLSQYTKIISPLGSSEMGIIPSFVPLKTEDWMYFEWNDTYCITMEDTGEGTSELVIPRRENSGQIHGIFHTFPDKNEYHSNDLFVQHPDNPRLWRYHGRRDDVMVLSNGEKLNPVTLEQIVASHPKVRHAVLIGQNRFQTALLVQPDWEETGAVDKEALIDEIWPTVERANDAVPNYGRVAKNKVGLATRQKPFKTTPKGTTQRKAVNKDYEAEIDALYAAAEAESTAPPLPKTIDIDSLTAYVRPLVFSLVGHNDINDTDDLYSAGVDSLQTMQLARTLGSAVSSRQPQAQGITAQDIYGNPSISRLAELLLGVLTGKATTSVSRVDRINGMVAKYTDSLPARQQQNHTREQGQTVILTGSTGSLGTYLLSVLVSSSNVKKVYCFNRSDAASRQIASFEEKGLDTTALKDNSKVEFLQVSFGKDKFGLSDSKYQTLLSEVHLIIHNAWAVNFNIPLESFEDPHIRGLASFIQFSLASKHNAHLSFVSSVSTIGAWTKEMGSSVPEVPFEVCSPVMEQGYGESKHVAERMCLEASRKSGIPTTVFRVGQIAGPTTEKGVWNVNEWLPTLVATSKAIGKAPETLGDYDIDWVPVDTLAQIMIELLESRSSTEPSAFFHLMNPFKTSWSSIVPAVKEAYNIPAIPITEWIKELSDITNPSDEDIRQKPALKLLDFYRGLAHGEGMLSAEIDTSKTRAASRTMAGLQPIGEDLMRNWIRQWGF
ncbi:hypothetical protein BDV18DRAFT_168140 [Aspergillus unguis]